LSRKFLPLRKKFQGISSIAGFQSYKFEIDLWQSPKSDNTLFHLPIKNAKREAAGSHEVPHRQVFPPPYALILSPSHQIWIKPPQIMVVRAFKIVRS
jgi:transposase